MGNFENTKTMIDANIKPNGKQEITGMVLNGVLNQIVSDTEREVEKKLDKDKIATINGQRLDEGGNLVLTPGESYDDTEIKNKLTELSEEVGKNTSIINEDSFSFVEGKYFNINSLAVTTNASFAYCQIPIKKGEKYIITSNNGGSTSAPLYCEVSADNTSALVVSQINKANGLEYEVQNDGYLYINSMVKNEHIVVYVNTLKDFDIKSAIASESFAMSNLVYENGKLKTAYVTWSDGTNGTMNIAYDANGNVSVVTYTHGGNTYENRFTYVNGVFSKNEIVKI